MRYEKPLAVDLGFAARGFDPQLCVNGGAATGGLESCSTGTGAGWTCSGGAGPSNTRNICVGGNIPGDGNDCATGTGVVGGYCEVGPGGANDLTGCRTGPTP